MQQHDQSNWYDRNGVKRPDHIPFLTEEELEKTFKKLRAETEHGGWKQEGNFIICTKCPLNHSSPVPTNVLLQGTDDKGLPILKKIVLS